MFDHQTIDTIIMAFTSMLITAGVHNQKYAELCWAFAVVTCIHNALIRLMKQKNIPTAEFGKYRKQMEKTHFDTVQEICRLIEPRRSQLNLSPAESKKQACWVARAVYKVAYPTILKVI